VEVGAEALRQLASRGWSPLWVLTGCGEPRLPHDAMIATELPPAAIGRDTDAQYRRDERHTSYADDTPVRDRARRTSWDDPARPVRQDVLKAALELSAEALGEKAPPAAKQAELIALVYELLEEGLPRAKVLRFARAASA
jgi:hypothetical protein